MKTLGYASCSICTECLNYGYRDSMHPVHPCPRCGAKVLDGFSAQTYRPPGFLNWLMGMRKIDPSTMRIRVFGTIRENRDLMIRFNELFPDKKPT